MSLIDTIYEQIQLENLSAFQLWSLLSEYHINADMLKIDSDTTVISFGDRFNTAYADFEAATGKLIIHESSPELVPGRNYADFCQLNEFDKNTSDQLNHMNFETPQLFKKYQDLRDYLLPLCSLFVDNPHFKIQYDENYDYDHTTYRIGHDEYSERAWDAIYTEDSIDDDMIKIAIASLRTEQLTFDEAKKLVDSWKMTFGNKTLIMLHIPSGCEEPEGQEFPALIKSMIHARSL